MSPLTWHVDTGEQSTHVTIRGRTNDHSVSALQTLLGELTSRRTHHLTVDLTAAKPIDRALIAAASLHGRHVGVLRADETLLLLMSVPPAASIDDRASLRSRMNRYQHQASEALTMGALRAPLFTAHLLPVTGAARHTRDVVAHACQDWDLTHLSSDAAVIANELVSHTIRRIPTIMTIAIMNHPDNVYIWVRAGSPPDPLNTTLIPFDACLELLMIDSIASRWGCYADGHDTLLWAALSRSPESADATVPPP